MAKEEGEVSLLQIAVFDSSSYFRNMVVETLEKENYNVVGVAATVDKATEVFGSSTPNLVIVDIFMPDVGGLGIANFISEKNWDILVIMMSPLNGDDFVVESIKAGVVDYLKKPFEPKDILKSIRRVEQNMGAL